jgi:fructoselysine 6-kinase
MKLAAVGSNCVDFYQNVEGGKAYPGGGPVNMAVYTVRLGGEASYIGPVGNDDFGALMRRAVAEKNNNPIEDPVETEAEKKRTKVELIVVGIIAALIIIGTLPISCSETFSRFWIF